MSGNPFRRRPQPQSAAPEWYSGDSTSISRQFPPPDTERRPSKIKRVRIQTPPPLSPDSVPEDEEDATIGRVGDETHEGSPPPDPLRIDASAVEPAINPPDPFGRNESEDEASVDEELADNTRRNSAAGTATTVDVPVIKNPFQKTLASMEPKVTGSDSTSEHTPLNETAGSGTGRAGMDVESFKRLLMTGNKDTGPAEPSPAPSTATATTTSSYFTGDSSSNTDASSISRHSVHETQDERGGTAHGSGSSEDEVDAPKPAQVERPKPAPPKHRHGKSIGQAKAPETVSFSDFRPSTEPQAPSTRIAPKPIPPPPARRRTTSAESPVSSPTEQVGGPQPISSPPLQSRAAPPPPIARRTSQKQAAPEHSSTTASQPQHQASKPTKAPPPPPVRKSASHRSAATEPFPSPSAFQGDQADPYQTSDTPSRSSSISSQQRPNMPPPAPPPRRHRGSSKSSLDQTSTASSTLTSPRHSMQGGASQLEALEREAAGQTQKQDRGETVLADMDALQAEIDALRSKYGR